MRLNAFVFAAGLSVAAAAQPAQPGRVIGFAVDPGGFLATAILSQTLCQPADRVCPSALPGGPAPWSGGAAYNAIHGSVWHTQGTRMAEVSRGDCRLLCSVAANLVLGSASTATGLDVSESRRQMLQLESIPGTAALTTWHLRSCPPGVVSACRFTLPTQRHVAGAVALDEQDDVIYYAASVFGALLPANLILVAPASDPCNIRCRFEVPSCDNAALGPITGMGYDSCRRLLYVTDGRQTLVLTNRGANQPCEFRVVTCCPRSPGLGNYSWLGLDVEPAHPAPVGQSCIGRGCRSCPNMAMVAFGDATVGNPAFGVHLGDAQPGTLFQLAVAAGPCRDPGFPFGCGQWHTQLSGLVFLPPVAVVGSGTCDGEADVGLPVPLDFALCGARLCLQGLVVCPAPFFPPGLSLTNAVDLVID